MPSVSATPATHLHARAIVRRSAATRKRLRGRPAAERDSALRGLLSDLAGAMEPVAREVRSGPLTGRACRHADAREVSAALQAERAKVRGMLRRASGGRKPARPPYSRESFRGHVGWVRLQVGVIENELTHALPQARRGTREYRDEAQELLDRIDALQRRLNARRAQVRYWATRTWGRLTARDRKLAATAVATSRELSKLRVRAKRAVAAPIRVDVPRALPLRRAPTPAKRRRWTAEQASDALEAFVRDEGRLPKATDLPGNPALPSYAKVHELLGGLDAVRDDLEELRRYYALAARND